MIGSGSLCNGSSDGTQRHATQSAKPGNCVTDHLTVGPGSLFRIAVFEIGRPQTAVDMAFYRRAGVWSEPKLARFAGRREQG